MDSDSNQVQLPEIVTKRPLNRADSDVSHDSSSSPQPDSADNHLPGSRKGKFKTVQTEIRKASAMSKLFNRRIGFTDRMASIEGIKDLATIQAIKSFGKVMFKDFSDIETNFLAGI